MLRLTCLAFAIAAWEDCVSFLLLRLVTYIYEKVKISLRIGEQIINLGCGKDPSSEMNLDQRSWVIGIFFLQIHPQESLGDFFLFINTFGLGSRWR